MIFEPTVFERGEMKVQQAFFRLRSDTPVTSPGLNIGTGQTACLKLKRKSGAGAVSGLQHRIPLTNSSPRGIFWHDQASDELLLGRFSVRGQASRPAYRVI
jgi:hypothetical protein